MSLEDELLRIAYAELTESRLELSKARQDIGALVYCLKQAYNAQLSERSLLSISLLEEIHRHDPKWVPEPRAPRAAWPTKGNCQ